MTFLYLVPCLEVRVSPPVHSAVVGTEPLRGSESVEEFATITLPDASSITSLERIVELLVIIRREDLHISVPSHDYPLTNRDTY